MLDIVNELDEVIGQGTRADIHLHNRMHRATHIILTNSEGQVFVQLRSQRKDTNAGLWDSSAAGHVDAGESYLDCAARELQEELGVEVAVEQLQEIGRLPPAIERGNEFVRIYVTQSNDPIKLEVGEIDDGRWQSCAELEHWIQDEPSMFAASFLVIWETIRPWRESFVNRQDSQP